ncbi:MAG: RICIN domain-containing protein, partial [Lachnospiraceae bacterium]
MKKWLSYLLAWVLVWSSLYVTPAKAAEKQYSEIPNTTRTIQEYDDSFTDVVGFGEKEIHSRIDSIGTEQYRKVASEREFLQAVSDAAAGKVHVIEITKDLNLGYLEVGLTDEEKKTFSFFKKYEDPTNGYTNPVMEKSGVSKLDISNVNGLTIFSKTGCKIKHTELKLQKSANDVVIRNLSFDEMWQWDDTGKHKEVGWTFIKVNGATNVWIDHCSFTDAADGLIDIENGSSGITISWCQIGAAAMTDPPKDSAIYPSIQYMEQQYQNGKLGTDSRYYKLRKGGASQADIMAYAAYHSKCHLVGSGDKDFCNYVYSDGRVLKDCNAELHLTLAYNYYRNMGQRQPMVRQGVGHLINCYFDNSSHAALQKQNVFAQNGGYGLARGLNARNGASIAADTCVFQDVNEPIVGAEVQGDDTSNMSEQWANLFQNAVNHSLIVNSTVSNDKGTYTGSSWDNNGDNLFTTGFTWKDKKSIGNWAWSSSINGVENMDKSNPPETPFTFSYSKEALSYTYKVLPLEKVKEVIPQKSGAGSLNLSEKQWCSVRTSDLKNDSDSSGSSGDAQKPQTDAAYPVQKFRIGIGDTNRNINISGFGDHSALNSWITNGEENEKWYLQYMQEGVYKIINSRTGKLITAQAGGCTIASDENSSAQLWKIEGVEKDFNGAYLYYKITSVADPNQALTFRTDGNRVKLEPYTGSIYQKMKLNCDGLEGFAANCKVSEGEKAGAIGGLLGETVVVKTMEEMKQALVETRPLTIVVSGNIDCRNENYDWRIEDDKTIIGAYAGNQLHDCKLRTNDYFKNEAPSDNIILKNLNIQIDTNEDMIALAIYSSKNIWVDHCTFHCDLTKEYDEVGKFIWINTPYDGEDLKRSPDFVTISYNRFENRFWGVAFGTQNGSVKENRASIFYNVFDSIVQRCPQMGNGTMHVNSNYYVRKSTSIYNDGMSQIKCGENGVVYSQSNRFENFKKESSGYWDHEVTIDAKATFVDYDSYTNKSENGGGTPVPYKVDGTYTKTTWNPAEQYGFTTLSAYDSKGTNDVKAFCDTYAGMAASQETLHYVTDSSMKTFVKKSVSAPFLKQPTITDKPEEEPSEPSQGNTEKPSDTSKPEGSSGVSKPEEGSVAGSGSVPGEGSQPEEG